MSDFFGVYVDGNIFKTFVNLFEVVIALDLFTMLGMMFANAKNEV